jgi:thiosulfate/3-mercaptopyruvate sulfurtransferase
VKDADAVSDLAHMERLLATHGQILDARSAGRFAGTAPEPRPGIPSGHMPGATSVPFTDLLENGRLKQADQLRELFSSRGVDLRQPITTTCGSGVTAAVVSLALEVAGASRVSLYDGSWAEYAGYPDAMVEETG